ncbi:Polysaccharide biosynthesis/export protein [Microbulbifer aggregans]|uniref:Polysaccharide biosynthesis/export protein n=1 Tax=Microbulbifer aggregans TaxID=1769779 RepID=A0A1C9W7S2_9GAMM|nr:polysaccharide biosynthesis/export family protein [Microbulbifer aggregans]AOS97207.1 Polysaccharide biosynthesis/export protein [Microbulbifer aggregans]
MMGHTRSPGQRAWRAALSIFSALWLVLAAASAVAITDSTLVDNYRLGSGDKILINVYGEDDLTVETQLSDSGLVNYPFLGELKVNGMTVAQLEATIHGGLKDGYLVNPNVHVSIMEYRPFYIHGEVERPGGYPYQPGLTVSKAAALAQGFTERASESKIFVVRGDDSSKTPKKITLNTELRPGDVVTVEQRFF